MGVNREYRQDQKEPSMRRANSEASERLARSSKADIRPASAGDVMGVAGTLRNFV
jgi:hypothetical protein